MVPARFVVACKNGHLDDFPWREFVHHGPTNCKRGLKLLEPSATGEAASIFVQCEGENCGATRPMSDAFKTDQNPMPLCRGQRARLSRKQPTWVPASEIRGEDLFFQFQEEVIQSWCNKAKAYDEVFLEAHQRGALPGDCRRPMSFIRASGLCCCTRSLML